MSLKKLLTDVAVECLSIAKAASICAQHMAVMASDAPSN